MNTNYVMAASLLFVFLLLIGIGFMASASHGPPGSHLAAVGPVSPDNGFPMWYQDSNGLILSPCTDPEFCFFLPPDPTTPASFPSNYPDEVFFWAAEAIMIDATPANPSKGNGILGRAILTLALEGAFFNGPVVPGDQVVFGRIRIRVDNLVPGETYTVTHPYGVNVFDNLGLDAGPGVIKGSGISFVEDIGIGAQGDFTGALDSRIGPFLVWDPATAPAPPPGFIGDGGLTLQKVIGSPSGTNFFRVEGLNVGDPSSAHLCADPTLGPDPIAVTDCIETDLFSVQGQIATNFGVAVDRATYSRNAGGAGSVAVFASSVNGQPQTIQASDVALGTTTLVGNPAGNYFGELPYFGAPPASITASNISDTPATVINGNLADLVTITRAEFNLDTGQFLIEASSSDAFNPPALTAVGYGPLSGGSLVVSGLTLPPWQVTVTSAAGGSDTEPVKVVSGMMNISPMAVNDLATTPEETAVTVNVTANDTDIDGTVITTTVTIINQPLHGTLLNNGDGTVTYTPDLNFFGSDSFTYTVQDNGGATSNQAAVALTVTGVNDPPVAVDDNVVTHIINVLANDFDVDGSLNPASVSIIAPPANGTAVVNLDGTITYTPTLGFSGSDTFTYTVNDVTGATSNQAAVTITVTSGGNNTPLATIGAPASGNVSIQGTPVTFSGTAADFEDGDLTASLVWTSSLDGLLGSGGSVTVDVLSIGTHTITASATDSGLLTGSDAITITILGGSSPTAVGPVHPSHGFPVWYQDSLGTVLELCLNGQDPFCGFVAGDIPNPLLPVSFPDNFPQEATWWSAEALLDSGTGQQGLLTLAMGAGFVNVAPVAGEQMSFARTRIRLNGMVPGAVYTITHPYGTEVLAAAPGGVIDFLTVIGGDVPNDFVTAMNAFPGPFLTWAPLSDAPLGYMGDPRFDHVVTGSPLNTNFFRIEGPNAGGPGIHVLETDRFFIAGKMATPATGPTNTPPTAAITAPLTGSAFNAGDLITFTGTAVDAEEGDLSASLVWTTNLDGQIGTGAALSLSTLSPGAHTVTASVVDSGALSHAVSITLSINGAPSVSIASPTSGSSFTLGAPVTFTGSATDLEDGDLTAGLVWSSDLDGTLGSGGTFSTSALSVGTHLITASVTDSGGVTSLATTAVTIMASGPVNTAPAVTITAPADGTSVEEGTAVTFTASATDAEDGDLAAGLVWSSDLDGVLGSGGSVTLASLSVGTHLVTASVTDSGGLTTATAINVTITPPPPPDTVIIDKAEFNSGKLQWKVQGTGSIDGNLITIYIGPAVGGQILATNIPVIGGTWRFSTTNSPITPDGTGMISISSSGGGVFEGFSAKVK